MTTPPPSLPDIMASLTWFTLTLRRARDNASFTLPVPPAVHIERIDAALRILGSIHVSPGAQIILAELGHVSPGEATA